MTELRDYQKYALNQIEKLWGEGQRVIVLQLPTGAGKTVLFSELIKKNTGKTLFVAHRNQLLVQASLCLANNGLAHDLIASEATRKIITQVHHLHFKQSYYKPRSPIIVSAVDTLIRKNIDFNVFSLVIVDEGHHVIRENKWGSVLKQCKNARILLPTATPERLDGKGLGKDASGFADALITGESMENLIKNGFLSEYKIAAPPSDLVLANVRVAKNGEYLAKDLNAVMQNSRVIGDIAHNYVKFAAGKLGLTFVTDLITAEKVKENYFDYGVPCEIISSKTDEITRAKFMTSFRNRNILQLISVDLLGEGVDIPAVEVVSLARPTKSYAVYAQQIGRALRPSPGKTTAIIIDHVGNVFEHGLPDTPKVWSLDDKKTRKNDARGSFITTCLSCFLVYPIRLRACPFCNHAPTQAIKRTPEQVEGDLTLVDKETLNALIAEANRIRAPVKFPNKLGTPARLRLQKLHKKRKELHEYLSKLIEPWDKKTFYDKFGVDVLTAQTLGTKKAEALIHRIENDNKNSSRF